MGKSLHPWVPRRASVSSASFYYLGMPLSRASVSLCLSLIVVDLKWWPLPSGNKPCPYESVHVLSWLQSYQTLWGPMDYSLGLSVVFSGGSLALLQEIPWPRIHPHLYVSCNVGQVLPSTLPGLCKHLFFLVLIWLVFMIRIVMGAEAFVLVFSV